MEQILCPACLLVVMVSTSGLAQDLAIPDDPGFRVFQMLTLVTETTSLDPSHLPTPLADEHAFGSVCSSCNRVLVVNAPGPAGGDGS